MLFTVKAAQCLVAVAKVFCLFLICCILAVQPRISRCVTHVATIIYNVVGFLSQDFSLLRHARVCVCLELV